MKVLTVEEFYYFYHFLKEVMPVMNLISKNYEEKEQPKGILNKLDKKGLFRMTITPEIDYQFPKMNKRKSDNKHSFMALENILEEA